MNTFTHRIHHRPQTARRGESTGFTLVEVIITIVISSVLFMTIGTLFVTVQRSWLRGYAVTGAKDDFRAAKMRIEFAFRNSTGPVTTDAVSRVSFYTPEGVEQKVQWVSAQQQLQFVVGGAPSLMMVNVTAFNACLSGPRNSSMNLTISRWLPVAHSSKTYTISSTCRNLRN